MLDDSARRKSSPGQRVIKVLASLKLAVVIIAYLCVLLAVGTFTESNYDAAAAKKLVYDTWWMYVGMIGLSTSLIAVMVDRWPWKRRHTPFVLAHLGILLILLGSVLTMKFGLDGNMAIEIGKRSRFVQLANETDLVVTASFDGQAMTRLVDEEVDFFRSPPTPEHPKVIKTDAGEIEIRDYKKYALPSKKVVAVSDNSAGAGLRFQIQNERVNVVEWVVQRRPTHLAVHEFGPAKLFLGPIPKQGNKLNEIYLEPKGARLAYAVFGKDSEKPVKTGEVEEGGRVSTGWMGLELRVLRYLPQAREEWEIQDRPRPTPLTVPAILVRHQGRDQWLLLDDTLRLFTENAAYFVSFIHRPIDVGFQVQLENFEMIPYAGTNKAKEYQSVVRFGDGQPVTISMNEPAKVEGLTFYQASFQNDPQGKPIASVFSVNVDPGRFLKYLGSLIMSLGIITLFYFRRQFAAPAGGPQ